MKFEAVYGSWTKIPLYTMCYSSKNLIRCNLCNRFASWDSVRNTVLVNPKMISETSREYWQNNAKCPHCKQRLFK